MSDDALIFRSFRSLHLIFEMISFRYRSNVKRIKIKTNKRLDERMSSWLQKVFGIRSQIVGFKSTDNKYYDVDTFYLLIDKFYNSQVEIVEGNEQPEISFTSDNLNSSSFMRPSQPNTSELNHKSPSEEGLDEAVFVQDLRAFERKLTEGKQISILFEIHPGYKKQVLEGMGDIVNPYSGAKTSVFILLSSQPKKNSTFSIYMGKNCVVVIPLTSQFKSIILNAISRSKGLSANIQQNRALKVEDEAPSFTTHQLQERLNQDACFDYLGRMNREKLLSSYEYHKLLEKLEDNFSDFYKIFCEGIIDNDYESFKNEIRHKVQNNLEMLLSNVEEMDLSRPISREEQRKQNHRKGVPEIEIVKVENYFEVLDLIKDRLDPRYLGDIKQNLLDEQEEICSYFSKFIAREYGKEELTRKITAFANQRNVDLRPISRCVPRSKSTDAVRKDVYTENQMILDNEAPMFGSVLNFQPEQVASPIKNMSDIESLYKSAWQKLADKADLFAPEEYGLLYHYLQTKNDGILNSIQSLPDYEESSLTPLKNFLEDKMSEILRDNFSEADLSYLQTIKQSSNVAPIFENFRYECDINNFLSALKEELGKGRIQIERVLHKKSSDSQLLEKNIKHKERKFSDQNDNENKNQFNRMSPQCSPRQSDISLCQKNSDFSLYSLRLLANPWTEEFEEMLRFCDFQQTRKEEYLRTAYYDYNPSLFLWVRQFINNKETNTYDPEHFRQNVTKREWEQKGILKILPLYSELLKQLQSEGKISDKMRKWAVMSFMECSLNLIGSFELYLLEKDEIELVDTIKVAFETEDREMELYKIYSSRIQTILKKMCVNDEASLQMFKEYPSQIKGFIDVYYFTGDFEDLMENLDTLQTHHVEKSKLTFATLNFSGINTSPFEYDDGSDLFASLNRNIQQLIKTELPNLTDWKLGKIDKQFTSSSRLGVGFSSHIDTVEGRLLNKEEFATIWRTKFDNWQNKDKVKATEEEISMTIQMDYIFYRAVIKQVYNISSFDELNEKLKTYDSSLLNAFLEKQFDRPASKIDIKQNNTILYLLHQKIDAFYLQEAGTVDWKLELTPGYAYHKNHDSVILYKKEKFGRVKQDLMQRYEKVLDFNNDTSFIFTEKNYLLISAHLKAKKIHIEQAKEMFETLKQIKKEHPLLRIVIGMDANHYPDEHNFRDEEGVQKFFMVPDTPEKPTSIKKRSFLQAQYKKAGISVSEVKDEIVTTHKIVEYVIEKINGEESSDELIPNDIHPYDHYIVKSVIKFL